MSAECLASDMLSSWKAVRMEDSYEGPGFSQDLASLTLGLSAVHGRDGQVDCCADVTGISLTCSAHLALAS